MGNRVSVYGLNKGKRRRKKLQRPKDLKKSTREMMKKKMMFKLHTIHTNCFSKDNKLMCTFNFAPIILFAERLKGFMVAKRCKIYILCFKFSFWPSEEDASNFHTMVCKATSYRRIETCVHWSDGSCMFSVWTIIKYDKLKYKICN